MPDTKMAWRCKVCGYVDRGPEPPESCPVCGASREEFEPSQEETEELQGVGPPAEKPARVVVVGAGAAGIAAVESLRAAAPATEITVISQESESPYYRLNLTRYLAGEISRDQLPIHPPAWYSEHDIRLLLDVEVARIDLEGREVELGNGDRLGFDKLLLAAGADPFIPPFPGTQLGGVTALRTIGDADRILAACEAGARCVCIGGGILGLEAAGALARRGAEVTLLESHRWLMPRQLNERAGSILGDHVNSLGIKLLHEVATREILGEEQVQGVLLEDGAELPADLVIIATGVRANCSLARDAGLGVGNGVLVDNHLTTSHPDVLAAGDTAEHDGVLCGLWSVAHAQGTIAGMNLAGAATVFGGMPRSNTLKVLGLDLFSIGRIMPEGDRDRVIEQEQDGRYTSFVFREDRPVGAILLGDLAAMPVVKQAVESGRDCSGVLRNRPTAETVIEYLRDAEASGPGVEPAGDKAESSSPTSAVQSPGGGVATSYRCTQCGYVYDEGREGKAWSELPDDWVCPVCGAEKSSFEPFDPEAE